MAITTVNSYLTASGLNFRSGTTGAASLLLDPSSNKIHLSGNFDLGTGSFTIGGNPIVTGSSSSEGDTLASVTARGASTSSNLSLAGNITTANGKYIGIGSTQANIEFGNGTIGNELTDLSLVTDSDGEITFYRGESKAVIGSSFGVYNSDFFVDNDTFYVDVSADSVGIGTQTPSADLHIHGSDPVLKIRDSSTSDNTATLWLQESDTYGVKINYESNGGHGGLDYLTIDTLSASDSNNQAGNHANAWGLDQRGNVLPHKGAVDGNLLRPYEWNLYGTQSSGGTPSFPRNGATEENERIYGENPFGEPAILWYTPSNDAGDNADGGWNSDTFVIDRGKSYRTSVWVKKTTTNTSDGNLYLGTSYVANISNSTYNSNPYFIGGTTMATAGMETGQWYLMVGYIYDSGHTGTTHHPDGGIYDRNGKKIYSATSFKFTDSGSPSDGLGSQWNTSRQRVYNYYDATTGSKTYWWGPRFEPLEASTPTLQQILNTPSSDTGAFFAGNVGIGTTGPSSTRTLHVQGDAEINTNLVANTAVYTKDWYGIGSNDQRILTSAGTAQVTIKNGGDVGIGTTSPNAKLEILGSVADDVPILRLHNTSNANGATIQFNDAVNSLQNANITYRHTDSESQGGGASFHITGESDLTLVIGNSSRKGRMVVSSAGSASEADYGFYDDVNMGMSRMSADELGFITAGTERMRILSDGKVGIGVTNPDATLEVKGAGNSSASTSFVVRDSDDAVLLKARNDGVVTVEHNYFYVSASAGAYVQNNLRVRGSLFNDAGALVIGNSNGTNFDGDVNFDANTLFVDSSENNVGIGTSDPSAQFYNNLVVGNNSAGEKGITIRSNASNGGHLAFSDTDSADAGRYAGRISYSHSTNKMQFYTTAGDHAMTIDNAQSVGIGTTAPSNLNGAADTLVVGGGAANEGITIFAGNSSASSLYLADGTAGDQAYRGYITYSHAAEKLSLGAGGQTRITATNAGLVGINQTNPTSKLHIYGGDNTGLAGSLRNDSKNRMNMKVAMADVTRYIGTVTQYGNGDSAGFTIRIYDGAEKVFRIVRVVVQNSGGTNYPSITVEGGGEDTDIHIDLKYKNRDGDATKTDFFLDPTGTKYFNQYIEIEGFIFKETGYNTTSLSSCSLDTDLALNVLDHGNGSRVGIGTTDPSAKLHAEGSMIVKGDASWAGSDNNHGAIYLNVNARGILGAFSSSYARNLIQANNNYIELGNQNTSLIYGFKFYAGSTTSSVGTYDFFTSGTNSRLHIEKGGNVGIGTTDPAKLLDINGDTRVKNAEFQITSSAAYTTHLNYQDGGNNYISQANGGGTFFRNNGGTLMFLNSAGDFGVDSDTLYVDASTDRVGIGTTSPDSDFSIVNTAGIVGMNLKAAADNICYIDFGDSSDNNIGGINYSNTDDTLNFRAGNANRVTITSAGNVAIGNTSAGAKVDIRTDSSTTNGTALRAESSTGAYFRLYHGGAIDTDGNITAARFIQDTNVGNNFYAIQLSRSASSDSNPDIYGSDNGLVLGANSSEDVLKLDTGNTVLVRGGSDPDTNSYKADFAVGCGGSPQISWRNQQVQIGGTDMNWAGKVYHDGTFHMAAWASHLRLFTQGGGEARDIYFNTWDGSSLNESMRILGEGRVGIGTNNPSVLLDVYNTGGWGNIDIDGTSGGELRFQKAGSTYLAIYASDTSSTSSVIKATDHLHIYSNADSDGSHSIYLNDAGNVGIGTVSPSVKLDVNGNIKASQVGVTNIVTNKIVKFGGTYLDDSIIHDDGTNIGIGTTSISSSAKATIHAANSNQIHTGLVINSYQSTTATAGNGVGIVMGQNNGVYSSKIANVWTNNNPSYLQTNIAFYTMHDSYTAGSETEKMRLTSQGYLGIGTTAPRGKLDVVGNTDDDTDFITIHDLDPSAGSHRPSIRFRSDSAQIGQIVALDNGMRFSVGDSETSHLEIRTDTKNVGIGTNSPDYRLTVDAGATNEIARFRSTDNDAMISIQDNTDAVYIGLDASADVMSLGFSNTVGSTSNVNFTTGGNVGIGTIAPSYAKLDIMSPLNKNVILTRSSTDGQLLHNLWVDSSDHANFTMYANGETANVKIQSNSTSYFNGGNVGIGTTNPDMLLTVEGKLRSVSNMTLGSDETYGGTYGAIGIGTTSLTNGQHRIFAKSSDHMYLTAATSKGFRFRAGGGTTDHVTIASDGDVGIGTTSPSDKLEVYANGADAVIRIHEDAGTHQARLYLRRGGSDWEIINDNNLTIEGEGTERMRINVGDGKVGIGTNSPQSQLHVEGTVQTKVFTIGALPSASPAGQRAMVSDSYYTFGSSTIGQTVYAGGSAVAPVYSDGSYWRYG